MATNFLNWASAATVMSIAIVALAGSCDHPRSTSEAAIQASKLTTASSNEVRSAMIGKQITIHGKLLSGKIGWYVLLGNQQEIYFFPRGPSEWGSTAEMRGKLVTATGTVRFFQCAKNPLTDSEGRVINNEARVIDRCSDYYAYKSL